MAAARAAPCSLYVTQHCAPDAGASCAGDGHFARPVTRARDLLPGACCCACLSAIALSAMLVVLKAALRPVCRAWDGLGARTQPLQLPCGRASSILFPACLFIALLTAYG